MSTKLKFEDEKLKLENVFRPENCHKHPIKEIQKVCLHPNCLKTLNTAFLCKKCYEEHSMKHQNEGNQAEYIKYRLAVPGKLLAKLDFYLASEDVVFLDNTMKNVDNAYDNYQRYIIEQINESKRTVKEFLQKELSIVNSAYTFKKLKQDIANNVDEFAQSKADFSVKLLKYFERVKVNYKELKSVSDKIDVALDQNAKIQILLKEIEEVQNESFIKLDEHMKKFIENFNNVVAFPKNHKSMTNYFEESSRNGSRRESEPGSEPLSANNISSHTKKNSLQSTDSLKFGDTIPSNESPYGSSFNNLASEYITPSKNFSSPLSKLSGKDIFSAPIPYRVETLNANSGMIYKNFKEDNSVSFNLNSPIKVIPTQDELNSKSMNYIIDSFRPIDETQQYGTVENIKTNDIINEGTFVNEQPVIKRKVSSRSISKKKIL